MFCLLTQNTSFSLIYVIDIKRAYEGFSENVFFSVFYQVVVFWCHLIES